MDPLERRLGRELEERGHLGRQRLAPRHLLGVGRRDERTGPFLAVGGLCGAREALDDRRKLEDFEGGFVHLPSVGERRVPLCAYLGGLMLSEEPTQLPALEVVWLHDATVYAFVRSPDGTCGEGGLLVGESAELELEAAPAPFRSRRFGITELIELADGPPGELALDDSARGAFALVTLARRTVSEGLVHPQLTRGGPSWFAFWGATLDDSRCRPS